jgi:hypothetical protein
MKKKMEYQTCCVGYPQEKIQDLDDMIDMAKEISYNTFRKYVSIKEITKEFDYKRMGLTIKGDWHISYYKSFFLEKPCVYMKHSGIEYIYQ